MHYIIDAEADYVSENRLATIAARMVMGHGCCFQRDALFNGLLSDKHRAREPRNLTHELSHESSHSHVLFSHVLFLAHVNC